MLMQGRIQDLIGGGASFVEFWCWGLIFGGRGGGGPGPRGPPGSAPVMIKYCTIEPVIWIPSPSGI